MKVRCTAIVNPANSQLKLGSGIAGLIRESQGGRTVQNECNEYIGANGHVLLGRTALTSSGQHKNFQKIIHACGPRWPAGDDKSAKQIAVDLLYDTYINILGCAHYYGLSTIAMPLLSTGVFHFPKKLAIRVALTAIKDFMLAFPNLRETPIKMVVIVLSDEEVQ